MAEVVLDRVGKTYVNGVQAVRDLSLTIADGELLALVGPSGCGKTTTLRLIAGLEQPTAGTLRIGGQVVNDVPPWRRGVGMAFQRPALYPHLSVYSNLAFGLTVSRPGLLRRWLFPGPPNGWLSRAQVRQRITETAQLLGLEGLLQRRPAQLSGGQQQRVALGRALVRRPEVLLLDEPLSNLDSGLRLELRRELHLLHRRFPATMIYVTHDPVEAMTLSDRVAVMDAGVVQQVDRPQEVYERPVSRFVAGFLGWPPMNFLNGQVSKEGDRLLFVSAGLKWPLPVEKNGWSAWTSRPATLGLRPQDIQWLSRPDAGATLEGQVALLEPYGGGTLLTVVGAGWRLTALTDRGGLTEGQRIMVSLHLQRAHLFDRDSGASLDVGFRGG